MTQDCGSLQGMQITREQLESIRSRVGRPGYAPKLTAQQKHDLVRKFVENPESTQSQLAREYGVTPQTVNYHIKKALRGATVLEDA